MNRLFFALILLWGLPGAIAATRPIAPMHFGIIRYVAPSGNASNDGLTTNTPWSLSYALSQADPSTILSLLPGTYPTIEITRSGTRLSSPFIWAARVQASNGSAGVVVLSNVSDVVIERLQVTGSSTNGISLGGSNCVVRSCWIHDCAGAGIVSRLNSSTLIERNLVEHNGTSSIAAPGISVSGTNCIIRGNVLRYNQDWGCQIYAPAPYGSAECDFYDNLLYGNGGGLTVWSAAGQTNYVFSNTIVSTNNNCLLANYGTLFVTNNLLFGGNSMLMYAGAGAVVLSDYNLVNMPQTPSGTHDVLSSDFGFVNAPGGLYWLSAASPALGVANSGPLPPVDFFGNPQKTVADIGAFQFSSALAADARVLDPSTTNGADYWAVLRNTNNPPVISSPPMPQVVKAGQDATFTVGATGSSPLNYQWTFNGSKVGANSSTYTRSNCQITDNNGRVEVVISNAGGTSQSSPAALTVTPAGPTFYAAATGAGRNDGLSPNSPWDLATACQALTNANTIIVLPGLYTNGPYIIRQGSGPGTLMSQTKWQAVICNSPAEGFRLDFTPVSSRIVIDGFCISNVVSDGISFVAHHSSVRNCWIYNSANGSTPHDGINSSNGGNSNNIIEYNLVEYTHARANDGKGHGLYLGGPDNIVRGNVFRFNGGYGIHRYTGVTGDWLNGSHFYNNLTYGHTNNYGVAMWGANGNDGSLPGTNYVYGNTFLDGIQIVYGGVCLSNNIILPSPFYSANGMFVSTMHPPTVLADYNLGTNVFNAAGLHDVITTWGNLGLVNPAKGLYWLTSSSPARGKAFSTSCGTTDFFNRPQSSVSDIGAFQYSSALAGDVRVLNPSGSNPDYWSLP